jgi:hypothetical protein
VFVILICVREFPSYCHRAAAELLEASSRYADLDFSNEISKEGDRKGRASDNRLVRYSAHKNSCLQSASLSGPLEVYSAAEVLHLYLARSQLNPSVIALASKQLALCASDSGQRWVVSIDWQDIQVHTVWQQLRQSKPE